MREIAVVVQNENEQCSVEETIYAIKNAGFKNVFIQWYDEVWEYSQEKQVNLCKKLGLNIIFAHLGYQTMNSIWEEGNEGEELVERYKKNIKECKENGIDLVIMHLTRKFEAPMYGEIGLNRIRKIVEYAEQMNVKIAFENTKIRGYLEYVFNNIKSDNIGLCYDIGHDHVHFNDELDLANYKDRIFAIHLHDNDQSDDQHLLPFDGTINWDSAIKKIKENNYNGPVTLEICYRGEYLKQTVEEFYKKGYEIGNKILEMFEN